MSFAERISEDRRLCILRLLVEAEGRANESVLKDGLTMLGLDAGLTRDVLRSELNWLSNRGLLRIEWFNDKVAVAHIQRRGVETAAGKERVEGVARPSLGE